MISLRARSKNGSASGARGDSVGLQVAAVENAVLGSSGYIPDSPMPAFPRTATLNPHGADAEGNNYHERAVSRDHNAATPAPGAGGEFYANAATTTSEAYAQQQQQQNQAAPPALPTAASSSSAGALQSFPTVGGPPPMTPTKRFNNQQQQQQQRRMNSADRKNGPQLVDTGAAASGRGLITPFVKAMRPVAPPVEDAAEDKENAAAGGASAQRNSSTLKKASNNSNNNNKKSIDDMSPAEGTKTATERALKRALAMQLTTPQHFGGVAAAAAAAAAAGSNKHLGCRETDYEHCRVFKGWRWRSARVGSIERS